MNKIVVLKFLQVLMLLSALFELYVAYVSPTKKETIVFILSSFVCMITFVMLKRRVNKLELKTPRIKVDFGLPTLW